jgi:hypothetical protein
MAQLNVTKICEKFEEGVDFICVEEYRLFPNSPAAAFTKGKVYRTVKTQFGVEITTNFEGNGIIMASIRTGLGALFEVHVPKVKKKKK